MSRRGVLCLTIMLLLLPALAGAVTRRSLERSEDDAHFEWQMLFPGASNTLPYGLGDPGRVRDHAFTMSCVQMGIDKMLATGYTRTPQYDAAFTQTGYSLVVIAFERPGHPDHMLEQPSLFVITKASDVPGVGWRPMTQVFAGMVYDSAGTPRTADDPTSFFVEGTYTGGNAEIRQILATMGTVLPPPYTAFDIITQQISEQVWLWWASQTPGQKQMFRNYGKSVAVGAATGATIASTKVGAAWPTIGLGAVLGAWTASTQFIMHPDTTGAP